MSSNRPNLTVDEQFFQELLAAAYTIQEHNDRLNGELHDELNDRRIEASPILPVTAEPLSQSICPQCGAPKPMDQAPCPQCGPDEFRPGERMQRKWASMWLMSQQQDLWPERASNAGEIGAGDIQGLDMKRTPRAAGAHDFAGSGIVSLPLPYEDFEKSNPLQGANGDHTDRGVRNGNGNGSGSGNRNGHGNETVDHADERVDVRQFRKPVADKFEFETEFAAPNRAKEAEELHPAEELLSRERLSEEAAHTDFDMTAPAFESATDTDEDLVLASESLEQVEFEQADAFEEELDAAADTALSEFEPARISLVKRIADWRVKLRFHRADVYLGVAIFVAGIALLWPVAGTSQQSTLSPWERMLVTIGVAEAPPPAVHIQGDPGIEVWVDPHSALYYCPGEDQYGKTADGRLTSQREAQMDRFEPAGRSACE